MGISRLCAQLLALYKGRLHSVAGVRYVFSFEMRDRNNTLTYFLVFASQHPKGLEKLKEAMEEARSGRQLLIHGRARSTNPPCSGMTVSRSGADELTQTFQGQRRLGSA